MRWRGFLLAGTVVSLVLLFAPIGRVAQAVVFLAWSGAAPIALLSGVRRRGPRPALAWWVLTASTFLHWAATVAWFAYELLYDQPMLGSWDFRLLYWSAYAGWFVFLSIMIHRGHRGDRGAVLDTVLITIGVSVVGWKFLLEPAIADLPPSGATRTLIYLLLLTGVSAAALRVALAGSRGTSIYALLVGWVGLEVVAKLWSYMASADGGAYGDGWLAVWLLSSTLLGALGLHPDLASVSTGTGIDRNRRLRPALLFIAAIAPLLAAMDEVAAMQHHEGEFADTLTLLTIGIVVVVVVIVRVWLSARDLTAEQQLRRQVEHASLHDRLTGLGNRLVFENALSRALAVRHSPGRSAMVMIVDLDGFKPVNDTYGHQAGDELLCEIARRMTTQVRDADTVARLGGDEFGVVIDDIEPTEGLFLADRLTATISEPVNLGSATPAIGASIGVYRCKPDDSPDDVLRQADAAMYATKAEGGGMQLFDPDRHRGFLDRYRMELQMRAAPAAGELLLDYQPIYRLEDRMVVAAEALVRWNHPERGLLQPGEFIELAETSGAIIDLGRWVLHRACRDAVAWQQRPDHPDGTCVAVNISRRQLIRRAIVADVADALEASGLPAELLTLEVTETALADEVEDMISIMHELRALGVQIAMDDFGSGYSSLTDLQRMPVDVLKIDRAFISGIARTDAEWILASSIMRLAAGLGKRTLAEGIEDPSQLAHLRSLGCELGQGYLLARPLPAEQLCDLLYADRISV